VGSAVSLRDVLAFILSRAGCISPFRISRILVLANWKIMEEEGKPAIRFKVEGFHAGFAVPEIEQIKRNIKEGKDTCFKINQEGKCIEYLCEEEPTIPEELSRLFSDLLNEVKNLDDTSLNRLVIRDPRYSELLKKGGFI
jgi:hypothetical protein